MKPSIASSGLVIGTAFLWQPKPRYFATETHQPREQETQRFFTARTQAIQQLQGLIHTQKAQPDSSAMDVFNAHIAMIEDQELEQEIHRYLHSGHTAESAIHCAIADNINLLEQLQNPYLRARASDLRDISQRLLALLSPLQTDPIHTMPAGSIVIAYELTPSDAAQFDPKRTVGWITERGSITSHAAIIARAMGLPALVNAQGAMQQIHAGDQLILDALSGSFTCQPSMQQQTQARQIQQQYQQDKDCLLKWAARPAATADHHQVTLLANLNHPNELPVLHQYGAQGIGLYRSEYLFMERDHQPSEEEQYQAYRQVLCAMQGKPVTIRTLDIGGDKIPPYLNLPAENNPYLGWRGIRLCLDQTDLLQTQLRALLRASVYGPLNILFPMVTQVDEVRRLKQHIVLQQAELGQLGITHSPTIGLGIMIETPAAVMLADQLIQEVDFFSIGTNDLTQYLLAVDRGNERIAHLYDSLSPAVLRAIKHVVEATHYAGKWVSLCGEIAADPQAALMLVGLGLDAFSMSSNSLCTIKHALHIHSLTALNALAERCLRQVSGQAVRQQIDSFLNTL